MPHTIGTTGGHTTASANPSTQSVTVLAGETVLVLMLKVDGAVDRTGGAPTYGGVAMTQADVTRKAASSPEASAELWYMLYPTVGTANISIPNAGSLVMYWRAVAAVVSAGAKSEYAGAAGSQGTGSNPSTTVVVGGGGGFGGVGVFLFAVIASGNGTWAPSARTGVLIGDHDDGSTGTGYQYRIATTHGSIQMGWTIGADDWGSVSVAFADTPIAVASHRQAKAGDGFAVTSERIR